jgi:hypothetical protein
MKLQKNSSSTLLNSRSCRYKQYEFVLRLSRSPFGQRPKDPIRASDPGPMTGESCLAATTATDLVSVSGLDYFSLMTGVSDCRSRSTEGNDPPAHP